MAKQSRAAKELQQRLLFEIYTMQLRHEITCPIRPSVKLRSDQLGGLHLPSLLAYHRWVERESYIPTAGCQCQNLPPWPITPLSNSASSTEQESASQICQSTSLGPLLCGCPNCLQIQISKSLSPRRWPDANGLAS